MSSTEVSSSVPRFIAPPASLSPARTIAADEIADVDVVARLLAVAEDLRRLALAQLAAEDRDDARLAVRVLARAVDVAEAQRHRRKPVEAVVEAEVALGAELALPVGGHRQRLDGLRRRQHVGLAVDRAARRGEDDAPAPRRRAASRTLIVPSTFVRASNAGSASEMRTSTCAARWKTASGCASATTLRERGAVADVAALQRAPPSSAPARLASLPLDRSSTIVTLSPRATSASTRCEPMNPAPPVTSVRMRLASLDGSRAAERRAGDVGPSFGVRGTVGRRDVVANTTGSTT